MEKPDVDYIEGLSPAISIDQKTGSRNPRSTVGTVTEIYDYLRLLFRSCGGGRIVRSAAIRSRSRPCSKWLTVCLPLARGGRPDGAGDRWSATAKVSISRCSTRPAAAASCGRGVDGEVRSLDEAIVLEKNKRHSIDHRLSDRVALPRDEQADDDRQALAQSALRLH